MLTELEIINAMLASTGTAPVTTNDTQHPFYVKGRNKLRTVNREVQSKGWWFNAGPRTLTPNSNGEVILPANTLHANPYDRADRLVIRGKHLYDLDRATAVLNRSVKVRFVELVEVSDLPPPVAEYLSARAVYEFYLDQDGNQPKLGAYRAARDEAWVTMKGEHLLNADVNFFDGLGHRLMLRGIRTRRLPL